VDKAADFKLVVGAVSVISEITRHAAMAAVGVSESTQRRAVFGGFVDIGISSRKIRRELDWGSPPRKKNEAHFPTGESITSGYIHVK
jgi:hypothetical protein